MIGPWKSVRSSDKYPGTKVVNYWLLLERAPGYCWRELLANSMETHKIWRHFELIFYFKELVGTTYLWKISEPVIITRYRKAQKVSWPQSPKNLQVLPQIVISQEESPKAKMGSRIGWGCVISLRQWELGSWSQGGPGTDSWLFTRNNRVILNKFITSLGFNFIICKMWITMPVSQDWHSA